MDPALRLPYERAAAGVERAVARNVASDDVRSDDVRSVDVRSVSVGESGSMVSGPGVRIELVIDDELRIAEAAFRTCEFEAARVVASRMCGAILGCTIDQASALSVIDVGVMAGLPPRHAAVRTVHFAKSAALLPHLGRRALGGAQITCTCFHVATETIRSAIRSHRLRTIDDLKIATKASTGCGCCVPDLRKLLEEAAREERM